MVPTTHKSKKSTPRDSNWRKWTFSKSRLKSGWSEFPFPFPSHKISSPCQIHSAKLTFRIRRLTYFLIQTWRRFTMARLAPCAIIFFRMISTYKQVHTYIEKSIFSVFLDYISYYQKHISAVFSYLTVKYTNIWHSKSRDKDLWSFISCRPYRNFLGGGSIAGGGAQLESRGTSDPICNLML